MSTAKTTIPKHQQIAASPDISRVDLLRPLTVFGVFSIISLLACLAVFQHYRETIKREKQDDLAAIAKLKTGQIENWMQARRSDARTLQEDPFFISAVSNWLHGGANDSELKAKLLARLSSIQQKNAAYGYTSISLFDTRASLLLSSSADELPLQGMEKDRLLESMQKGEIVLSEIHRETIGGAERNELELRAPLSQFQAGKKKIIAAVLFRISPDQFLFPLIQLWPTHSPSAETLLVRKDGDDVLFLNELRHRKNMALSMRMSVTRAELPAAMAVMGQEGLVEGIDYRGTPVIAALNKLPGTSWSMVSKVDKDEIYAPINHLGLWLTGLLLCLLGTAAAAISHWLKIEQRRYASELGRRTLFARLDHLSKYANDIILLSDDGGKIIDFNDRALDAYGYSAENLISLNISDLEAIDLNNTFARRMEEVKQTGALRFESTHVRYNGEPFPVEASIRVVDINGKMFLQSIIRDISQRKHAETLMENERIRLHTLLNTIPDLVWLKDTKGVFLSCNPQIERLYGAKESNIVGKTDYDFVDKELADWFTLKDREAMAANKPCINEEWVTFPDNGQRVLLETIKTPMRDADGALIGIMGIARDITKRKLSEARESRLRHILNKTRDMIYIFQPGSFRFVYVNQAVIERMGYSYDELLQLTPLVITPQIAEADFRAALLPLVNAEIDLLRFETMFRCRNGTDIPVEVLLQLVNDGEEENVFVATVRDISERIQAEIKLSRQKKFMWQVIDADPSMIFVKNEKEQFALVNQSCAYAHGMAPQQMVGKTLEQINPTFSQITQYLETDRRVIKTGEEVSELLPYSNPDGKQGWFLTIKKRLAMPDGEYGLLGIAVDITQQKQFEVELAESYRKLQKLALHLENIRSVERAKIALNLHDEMGATLAALKMKVSWLASKLPAGLPLLSAETVQINELISGGIHTMHHIVNQLHPDLLGDAGLVEAIRIYAKKFLAHSSIEYTLMLPEENLPLTMDQSNMLFHIFQESLNNVVKHAQASKLEIRLSASDRMFVMKIQDNGIGMDMSSNTGLTLGLLSIRERALMIGGKAKISSLPGKGVCISVSIPWHTALPEVQQHITNPGVES